MSIQPDHLSWYVMHTKPFAEFRVADWLQSLLSLTVYLPEALQPYRGEIQMRPLFPNYVFVQADLDVTATSVINATPGAIRLVSCDARPLPLAASIILQIREETARLNAAGGLQRGDFRADDEVRISSGPLQGLDAVFVRYLSPHERAIVLLDFLGRQNEVQVDLADIERAGNLRCRKRRRGTRGRGRVIHYDASKPTRQGAGGKFIDER